MSQSQFKGLLKTLGGMGGGAIGGFFGGPSGAGLGSTIGSSAGSLISKITGFGDYKVTSNTLTRNVGNGQPAATFMNSGKGIEICHREFLGDISGSVDFANIALNINPGLQTTFPWLSAVAQNFEQYEFLGLVFEYRPSSGAIAGTSPALGMVVFATNYDALDPLFSSKQDMESYQFCTSTVPFNSMLHPVECARDESRDRVCFIRGGPPPSNSDLRMYDLGTFQFATRGMPSVYTCGELWVSYHVRLLKPRISPTVYEDYLHLSTPLDTASAANPMAGVVSVYDPAGWFTGPSSFIQIISPTQLLISEPGWYKVEWSWVDSTAPAATTPVVFSIGANITAPNIWGNRSTAVVTSANIGTAICEMSVKVNASGTGVANRIVYQSGLTGLVNSNCDIIIRRLPTDFI